MHKPKKMGEKVNNFKHLKTFEDFEKAYGSINLNISYIGKNKIFTNQKFNSFVSKVSVNAFIGLFNHTIRQFSCQVNVANMFSEFKLQLYSNFLELLKKSSSVAGFNGIGGNIKTYLGFVDMSTKHCFTGQECDAISRLEEGIINYLKAVDNLDSFNNDGEPTEFSNEIAALKNHVSFCGANLDKLFTVIEDRIFMYAGLPCCNILKNLISLSFHSDSILQAIGPNSDLPYCTLTSRVEQIDRLSDHFECADSRSAKLLSFEDFRQEEEYSEAYILYCQSVLNFIQENRVIVNIAADNLAVFVGGSGTGEYYVISENDMALHNGKSIKINNRKVVISMNDASKYDLCALLRNIDEFSN